MVPENKPPARIRVGQIALIRSAMVGNHATIGLVARSQSDYDFLCRELTVARVADYFDALEAANIRRHELPRVGALYFVFENALADTGGAPLRFDADGRLLATAIAELELPPTGPPRDAHDG